MDLPKRKSARIVNYDYSSPNFYFITICTYNKCCIFGKPGNLNYEGLIAEEYLKRISDFYPQVILDKYVVMPNHIHAILMLEAKEDKRPNISHVIGQYKMAVTRKIHENKPELTVWQRSFHDHIIRNEADYLKIWEYIENNPARWKEDCFYEEILI